MKVNVTQPSEARGEAPTVEELLRIIKEKDAKLLRIIKEKDAKLLRITEEKAALEAKLRSEKSQPAPSVAPDPLLAKRLEAAWSIPYKDSSSNTSRLHEHLEWCYKRWKIRKKACYSPYFAIFQSSGHGKSRLVQELCTTHKIPHLYFCFRPATSSGFPLRTRAIADFLTTSPSQAKCDALLRAVLGLFGQVTKQQSDSANAFAMWEKYKNENATGLEDEIYKTAIGLETLVKQPDIVTIDNLTPSPFLFVFDEARELVNATDETGRSAFRMLRSSLREYSSGIFAILMDTLSNIANFTPTAGNDPSFRGDLNLKLLPPFHLVVNTDIFNPPRELAAAHIKRELTPSHLLAKGRILWASIVLGIKREAARLKDATTKDTDEQLLAKASSDDWLFIVELAAKKLVGGQSKWSVEEFDRVTCLSVLSARAQMSIAPTSDSSSVSVGSHLATCVSISKNREAVFSLYPSEPAVAAGAFQVVWGDGGEKRKKRAMHNYAKLLSHLKASLVQGIVDAGQCGELVARLLLNIAWDLSVKSVEHFYSMISLEIFLQNLIGMDRLKKAKECLADQTILTAQLCFTHFVSISYVPTEQDLVQLMSRGAAAICQRNQVGVDLMIPLLLKGDAIISAFLISVKNHKAQFDSSWPSSGGSGVSLQNVCPKLSDVPRYFTLLMQLGAPKSMVFAGQHEQHSALAVFGLSTFCPSIGGADHPVYQRLRAVLNARQGIEGISFDEASMKVVPNLVPLQWKAGGCPRALAENDDSSTSTTVTPQTNDAQSLTPQTFCLVDAVSRTRWTFKAYTNTTTDEVAALFQKQGLGATILRSSGAEHQMKRVLQPVALHKCICKAKEEVVFLIIDADDIGLVRTHPVRIAGNSAGQLHRQVREPGSVEELPGFVRTYLESRLKTEKQNKRKRKRDKVTKGSVDDKVVTQVRTRQGRQVYLNKVNIDGAGSEPKKKRKRKRRKKATEEDERTGGQKIDAIEANFDEANTEDVSEETEKKRKKKKRKEATEEDERTGGQKIDAIEANFDEANTEDVSEETEKKRKKKKRKKATEEDERTGGQKIDAIEANFDEANTEDVSEETEKKRKKKKKKKENGGRGP